MTTLVDAKDDGDDKKDKDKDKKDKKGDKDKKPEKKVKAKFLKQNVENGKWPPSDGPALEFIFEDVGLEFLKKWQPYADKASNAVGPKTQTKFVAKALCTSEYPCNTITNVLTAKMTQDVVGETKPAPITFRKMDKFLKHVSTRKTIKLGHAIHKDMLFGGEIHHGGIVARLTAYKKQEADPQQAVGMLFDAWKLMAFEEKPSAIRAVLPKADDKEDTLQSVCLFPKGSNKAQADNFCQGKDKAKKEKGDDKGDAKGGDKDKDDKKKDKDKNDDSKSEDSKSKDKDSKKEKKKSKDDGDSKDEKDGGDSKKGDKKGKEKKKGENDDGGDSKEGGKEGKTKKKDKGSKEDKDGDDKKEKSMKKDKSDKEDSDEDDDKGEDETKHIDNLSQQAEYKNKGKRPEPKHEVGPPGERKGDELC